MRRICVFVALGMVLSCIGCTSHEAVKEQQPPKPEPKKELKAPLAEYEATLRPSDYDEEVEVVQKTHAEEKAIQQIEFPQDSLVAQEQVQQGFRIQLFSSSNIDEVNGMKTDATQKFAQDSLYIVYDPPVYKLRLGDFVSRYDANQKLPEMIGAGFRDAWVVPDQVVVRKFVPASTHK